MKTAFVLSAGGAKGAWQVGVLRKLAQRGVHPDVIYGTSVGAMNAAGLGYLGAEGLEEIWRRLRSKRDLMRFNFSSLFLMSSGLYHTKPLKKLLGNFISGTPLCEVVACKVSLNTGEVSYVSNRNVSIEIFREAVQASASIPIIMSPVGEWMDGGTREYTPLRRAIRSGCTKIIVILTRPFGINPSRSFVLEKTGMWLRLVKVGFRAIVDIMEHEIFLNDLHQCVRLFGSQTSPSVELEVYAPQNGLGDMLDFSPSQIDSNIHDGQQAVVQDLGQLTAALGVAEHHA